MNKRCILLVINFIFCLISCVSTISKAQQSTDSISLNNIPRLENSIIWKITGNNLQQTSYIFATMHSICEEDYIWTEAMDVAFKNSEVLILEVDLSDLTAFQDSMVSFFEQEIVSSLNDSSSIQIEESDEDIYTIDSQVIYKGESDVATMHNVDSEPWFGKMQPPEIFRDTSIKTYQSEYTDEMDWNSSIMNNDHLDCIQQKSYELELIKLANSNKKSIKGLETIFEQLAIIYGNFDFDSEIPKVEESSSEIIHNIAALYKAQRLDEMYVYAMQYMGGPKTAYTLIDQRNIKWVEVIPNLIKDQSSFIAVGAAHLSGNNGIINLLRKKGYTITPIFNTN